MSWLESHQSLRDHPKKDRLAELLFEGSYPDDVADAAAIGLLHRLWWWALDYAPKGDLSVYTDRQIAKGCRWTGDAGMLVESLRESRFIDRKTGMLHDWDDYAGRLVAKREADAERKRAVRGTSGGRPADAPRDGAGTYLPTLPTNQKGQQIRRSVENYRGRKRALPDPEPDRCPECNQALVCTWEDPGGETAHIGRLHCPTCDLVEVPS